MDGCCGRSWPSADGNVTRLSSRKDAEKAGLVPELNLRTKFLLPDQGGLGFEDARATQVFKKSYIIKHAKLFMNMNIYLE